jgi:hypothetical protein
VAVAAEVAAVEAAAQVVIARLFQVQLQEAVHQQNPF